MATALERRGVRATYRLHDHVLSNRSSRHRFAAEPPELDELQRRIIGELDEEGYASLPFVELFPEAFWQAVEEQGTRFVAETEAALASGGAGLRVREGKEFVIRLHSYGVEIDPEADAWFRACMSHRLLDIANTYLGLCSKLEYADMWYSVPQPEDAARVSSQRWHRDFNDRRLLKVFLYLVDVDAGTGPFQYVPGSAPGGRYPDFWPWRPLGENYPPEEDLERRISGDAARTFTGPKGTLLFCNTAGFHRGGFATASPRVLATATYSSPASLASLTDRSYRYLGPLDGIDDATRFALT